MTKTISILRGINVAGQKKIKMADLKLLYEKLGFKNVITYIQSGNVIFDTDIDDINSLKPLLEKAINEKYNFHVPIVIRRHTDIKKIINNCPFNPVNLEADGSKILVTFLSTTPNKEKILSINIYVQSPEKLIVIDKEVYLHCPNGYGKSKLSNNFIEKKLGVESTTRNWKSVHKLYELSIEESALKTE